MSFARGTRRVSLAVLLAALAAACASAAYPYRTLGPDADGELKGTLLAAKPKDDRPLSDCAPTEQDHAPCIVVRRDVWERLNADLIDAQERLKACEEGKP